MIQSSRPCSPIIKRKRHHLWDPTTRCPAWPSRLCFHNHATRIQFGTGRLTGHPFGNPHSLGCQEVKTSQAPQDWALDCEPWHCHLPQDRLTHVQLLLAWKPAPLQSSTSTPGVPLGHPIEYLLLQPRSAPEAAPHRFTAALHSSLCVPLHVMALYIGGPP